MDLAKTFRVDETKELDGVWVALGEGAEVKIAKAMNPRFKDLIRAEMGRYKQAIQAQTLDDETAERVLISVMARTILLDWRGITEEGEEIPYTPEKAEEYLTNYVDFRDFVTRNSEDQTHFRAKVRAVTVGNSPTQSDGTTTPTPSGLPSSES